MAKAKKTQKKQAPKVAPKEIKEEPKKEVSFLFGSPFITKRANRERYTCSGHKIPQSI